MCFQSGNEFIALLLLRNNSSKVTGKFKYLEIIIDYIRYLRHERYSFTQNIKLLRLKKIANSFYLTYDIETHWRSSCLMENLYAIFSDETVNITGI